MLVALGKQIAAVFGNDDAFTSSFITYAKMVHEEIWQMPLFQPYEHYMKVILRLQNIGGGRYGVVNSSTFAHFVESQMDAF
jgi:leucyl aminopeptidase